jgi:hypothetical protein
MKVKNIRKVLDEDGEGGGDAGGGDTGGGGESTPIDTSGGMTTGNIGGHHPHMIGMHVPNLMYNWLPPYMMGRPYPYTTYGSGMDREPRRPRRKSKNTRKK